MGSPRLHFLFCWPGSGRGAASVWQRLCWVGNWTLSRSGAETSLTPFGESVEPTSHRENAGSQLLGAAFRGHPLARIHSFLRPLFATHLLRVRPCPRCWRVCAKKPTTWGVLKGFSAYRFNAVWWIIQQGVQGQWTRRTGAPNLEEVGVRGGPRGNWSLRWVKVKRRVWWSWRLLKRNKPQMDSLLLNLTKTHFLTLVGVSASPGVEL